MKGNKMETCKVCGGATRIVTNPDTGVKYVVCNSCTTGHKR